MERTRLVLLKIFFFLLTLLIIVYNFHLMEHTVRYTASAKGILDLSDYELTETGKLTLDGEWQFFLNRFVDPVKYADIDPSDIPDVLITPPKLWNYYTVDGKPIPGFAYGTYRLIVTGVKPNVPLALKILPESTAYDLYINEVQMAGNGVVGKDPGHSAPGYIPKSIKFTPHSSEFVLTIHISNFTFARGGLWDAPTLGTKQEIENLDLQILHRDLFLEGCYTITFLMFLVIFINRPSNRSLLYFGLLCAVTAARISIYGALLLTQYTENFRLITFLEYGTRLWYPLLMILLINEEFSGRLPKRLKAVIISGTVIMTATLAFLPIHTFTAFARLLMAYDSMVGVVLMIVIFWPAGRFFPKNKNKIFYCYGMISIFFSVVYDMFFASTSYCEMTPDGLFRSAAVHGFCDPRSPIRMRSLPAKPRSVNWKLKAAGSCKQN